MPPTPVGSLCIVLHTHLPWVAHHGAWPVGEEWLHQAWAHSYLPVADLLERLGAEGNRDLLSLGVTPVLAAQLDDPYCLSAQHSWLGSWQMRAAGLAASTDPDRREAGRREFRAASAATATFETTWRHGASPVLRRLSDAGIAEILGGPLAHAFTPDLDDHWASATLHSGLDDAHLRLGRRPRGIWTPECAYRPGLDQVYADAGVDHLMLEGPTLQSAGAHTRGAWLLADTDVRVVGRDLPLAYRVWSPKRGYPGGRWYRDFHTYDHEWGLKIHRVTGRSIAPQDKAPYDPDRAASAVQRDALDFVSAVRERLLDQREDGRPALAVVAYDTELFGHWWAEGPQWLEQVLRLLPEAGITPRSLSSALDAHDIVGRVHPAEGSWGSGKDFRVWTGAQTADLRAAQRAAADRVRSLLRTGISRDPRRDQLLTSLLLGLASDWIFMVSKDSAADYARARLRDHLADVQAIADELERSDASEHGMATWIDVAQRDRPWGHLDSRAYARCPCGSSTCPGSTRRSSTEVLDATSTLSPRPRLHSGTMSPS